MIQTALSSVCHARSTTLISSSLGVKRPLSSFEAAAVWRTNHRGHTGSPKIACVMHELPETSHGSGAESHTHLVVMANGLFGRSSNWDVTIEELQHSSLDLSHMLLVASNANSLTQVRSLHMHLCRSACSLRITSAACFLTPFPASSRLMTASIHAGTGWLQRSSTRLRSTPHCGTFLCLATPWVDYWCATLQVAAHRLSNVLHGA